MGGCLCSKFTTVCPYHAALRQKERLSRLFPERAAEDPDLPFFPTAHGHFVTAEAMVELIECLAHLLGEPVTNKSGVRSYGRHSGRATGGRTPHGKAC